MLIITASDGTISASRALTVVPFFAAVLGRDSTREQLDAG